MILPFNMEMQLKSRWCWAATSKSVSSFYLSASVWTHCSIASAELSLKCCDSPFPSGCNKDWYLDRALTRTENYVRIEAPVSWQEVDQEISSGLVVGARVGWFGGGGHFMIIHGTSIINEQEYLHIDDPISGKSMLTYNQFLHNYEENGRWTHTYFTKTAGSARGGANMWLKKIQFNPALLSPIAEFDKDLKSISNDFKELYNLDALGGGQTSINIPHYSYVLRLDDIINQKGLPETAGSLRLFKLSGFHPTALYEVGLDEKKPELFRISSNQKYFSQLENSIAVLQDNTLGGSEPGELRLLKLPALNLEAFWLHFDKANDADVISPVKKFEADSRFDWNRPYPKDEFWAKIRDYASEVDSSDDLLGG